MIEKNKREKRGQVTLFIIAGLVVLIAVTFLIILKYQTTIFRPEVVVPPELEPVNKYISDCLEQTSRDAITLIGINGGYINFPEEIESDPQAYISTNPFFKKDIKVPLWRYKGTIRIPTEDRMKSEIENYINKNIGSCFAGFEVFSTLFDISSTKNVSVKVDLLSKGVSLELDYPLDIISKASGQITRLNNYKIVIPVRLKTTYELAKKIMETENNDMFVELKTIDLIAMDPEIPYNDVAFDCTPKRWKINDVKDKLKLLLAVNLPNIKVEKTSYNKISDDRPYQKNHYVWKVTDTKYPSTKIGLSYDQNWPFYMYVSPNQGQYLTSDPSRGFDLMSFFCMNLWHFTYDVRYPVLVTVKDEKSASYEDYTFNFGFEAGINHNRPDKSNFNTQTFDFEQANSEQFCREAPKSILTVHTYENISRGSYEDYIELPGVDLKFTCIKMVCPMGESEIQFRGADVFTIEEVPYCIEGVLKAEKEGYEPSQIFVSTTKDKETSIYLTPVTIKEVSVVMHNFVRGTAFSEEHLGNGSSAIITLTRGKFRSSAFYPIEGGLENMDMPELNTSTLKLLGKEDYQYQVTVYLMDETGNLLGGYKGNWTPAWNELEFAKSIKFHILQIPYTEDEEKQVEFLINLEQNSMTIPNPELVMK